MTREEEIREKAKELAIKYCKDIDHHGKEVYNIGCAIACCEMADWKDQHPRKGLWDAEKVIDWLKENSKKYVICYEDGYSRYAHNSLVEDLRKAMEE